MNESTADIKRSIVSKLVQLSGHCVKEFEHIIMTYYSTRMTYYSTRMTERNSEQWVSLDADLDWINATVSERTTSGIYVNGKKWVEHKAFYIYI